MFLYSTAEKGNNCIIHRKISISREFPLFPRHSKPEAALFRKAEKTDIEWFLCEWQYLQITHDSNY